jgi:hypothetical protein
MEHVKAPGSPGGVALVNKSLEAFGSAIHTVMDNVSPAHGGFQVYSNEAAALAGAAYGRATGNPIAAAIGAAVGVANSNLDHDNTEDRDPTREEYGVMEDRIRMLFQEIYGPDAYSSSVQPEQRRETEERVKRSGISIL